jgi:hypothetical protein
MAVTCYVNEDNTYHKQEKGNAYEGERVIFFDNTDITIKQPTHVGEQQSTYSAFYGGNVGKGVVFTQPCGWMRSNENWTGGVSDSAYMQRSMVFNMLNKHLLTCPLESKATRMIPFTIVLDKGYCIVADAFNVGGQFT